VFTPPREAENGMGFGCGEPPSARRIRAPPLFSVQKEDRLVARKWMGETARTTAKTNKTKTHNPAAVLRESMDASVL
jgi:hypothetical protein